METCKLRTSMPCLHIVLSGNMTALDFIMGEDMAKELLLEDAKA
jgi:hypothetical protein